MNMNRYAWMLKTWLLVTTAAAATTAEPVPPAEALAAATTRWRLQGGTERLVRPGPVGQHDLFWEIIRVWERDKKSRKDADLEAVMSYLLFDARLAKDEALSSVVNRLIPRFNPGLGGKQVEGLLENWVVELAGEHDPVPLWARPSFPEMPREALAIAGRRMLERR